jgi:anti-sigma regulatory factor (Ser/Thr protein kinase)
MDDHQRPPTAPGPGARRAAGRPPGAGGDGLSHLAFIYRDANEYLDHLLAFIREGLAGSEPVFVALPGEPARRARAALGAAGRQLAVADMDELGRNPARITLALGAFADQHAGHRIRVVTESLWPERTDAETAEVMKHEALVERAAAAITGQILCPYDAARLGPAVIEGAVHTHPEIIERGCRRPSSGYQEGACALAQAALPPPPASAAFLAYSTRLDSVRALVGRHAEHAGLPVERCADLVLAVSEVAANTLSHTRGGGTVHVWASGHDIICQVDDGGWISDPMAGRRRPPPDAHGQGLWVVNKVCDLVETRSGPGGTTTRLRMRLPAGSGEPPRKS